MIYYFGDSHTAGIDTPKELNLTYQHTPYPIYLSKMMDMDYVNLAVPGSNLVNNVNILIQNLKEVVDNAEVVIFQFQFFQNAFFRFEESDFKWKDFVVRDNDVIDNLKSFNLTEDDKYVLVSYLSKFEERRSWYEMQKVYSLFNYIEKHQIKCYALYWVPPKIINIIDDERNIVFNKNTKFVLELNLKTIKDETNGKWNDLHVGSKSNKELANLIYNSINKINKLI
jgi:hypothetical protein